MASESTLAKLTNDVLEATEQFAARIEDGLSVVMSGKLPDDSAQQAPPAAKAMPDAADDFHMGEEEMMESPLNGIAENVIGDIMKEQVGSIILVLSNRNLVRNPLVYCLLTQPV